MRPLVQGCARLVVLAAVLVSSVGGEPTLRAGAAEAHDLASSVVRRAPSGRSIGAPSGRMYQPPVDAPVTDPFRPPPEPWLAGNRGIEYATTPGTPIGAIGPGVVTFAGPVAGALYVTVTHPDGLRSSYSFLAAIRTAVGDQLTAGQTVGVAAARFHVGVRRGTTYLDPASLWGQRVTGGRVVLVPLDGGPGAVDPRPAPPGRSEGALAGPTLPATSGPLRHTGPFGADVGEAVMAVTRAIGDALGPLGTEAPP